MLSCNILPRFITVILYGKWGENFSFTLRENCLNKEFSLVLIFPHLDNFHSVSATMDGKEDILILDS